MGINKFNHEGYHDPTPHEALTNIMRKEKAEKKSAFKPLVYICSPYSGDVEGNIKKARSFCRFALDQNCIPIAPILCFLSLWMMKIPKNGSLPYLWTSCLWANAPRCGCWAIPSQAVWRGKLK